MVVESLEVVYGDILEISDHRGVDHEFRERKVFEDDQDPGVESLDDTLLRRFIVGRAAEHLHRDDLDFVTWEVKFSVFESLIHPDIELDRVCVNQCVVRDVQLERGDEILPEADEDSSELLLRGLRDLKARHHQIIGLILVKIVLVVGPDEGRIPAA